LFQRVRLPAHFRRTELARRERLAEIEDARSFEGSDDYRIEPGIAHEPLRNLERFGVVAAEGNRDAFRLTIRLVRERRRRDATARAHATRTRQSLCRRATCAFALSLAGHWAVAALYRIARVEYDLALEFIGEVAADLGHRCIRH